VVDHLNRASVNVSIRTLRRRCQDWQLSRQGALDQATIERISLEFHTTYHNDAEIAATLNTSLNVPISVWQVKRVRLAYNWRRRAANNEQRLDQQAETFQRVESALNEGTARNYGRGHLTTYLRCQQAYPAREDDLRDALSTLDREGTRARQLGPKKRRKGSEFLTRGPDWLWCIDGHDKFKHWGLYIYAAVDAFSRPLYGEP
jgi:hypothetical protein